MEAAEDRPLPFAIFLSAGGVTVVGQVAPASSFYASTKSAAAQNAERRAPGTWGRRADERKEEAMATLDHVSQVMDWAQDVEEDDPDEVTLVNARVLSSDGSGVQLAVVRVPLDSVDAWWIASGSEIKAPTGGFFAVGASFPVD